MMRMAKIAVIAALLASPAACWADQTWTYTGNSTSGQPLGQTALPPNPCGCALDGTVVFAAPLTFGQPDSVLSFSFTDGAYSFDGTNSVLEINPFLLSSLPLDTWFFAVHALDGSLVFSSERYDNYEATDTGIGGLYVQANHGTWADPPTGLVAAPEPSSLTLLALALASTALWIRKTP